MQLNGASKITKRNSLLKKLGKKKVWVGEWARASLNVGLVIDASVFKQLKVRMGWK